MREIDLCEKKFYAKRCQSSILSYIISYYLILSYLILSKPKIAFISNKIYRSVLINFFFIFFTLKEKQSHKW